MKKYIAGIAMASFACLSTAGLACTDFSLAAQDGSLLITRTLEFAADLQSNLRTSPRGRTITETAPGGKPGMSWKAQYGYVFVDGMNLDYAVDGMNEKGLSVEALYLPGETQYQTVPPGQENRAVSYLHLGDWILGNFQSVAEVRDALSRILVVSQAIPNMGATVFPLHYAIYDTTGKGIVVEFVGGKMTIYDNDIGVMTNSPTYDWQITNLRNYVNLSPITPNPVIFAGQVFAATGQGAGMLGLPGDISPPSRFVKMAVMKRSVYPAKTAAEALILAQHMVNNVDIPSGFVRAEHDGQIAVETTQWTVFKDLTNKIFYYKTYGDTTLHSVALNQVDFSEKAGRLQMPLADNQYVIDVTSKFLQSKPVVTTPPAVTTPTPPNGTTPVINGPAPTTAPPTNSSSLKNSGTLGRHTS